MENIREYIEKSIKDTVAESRNTTKYRTPLIGFADAHDNRFSTLKEVAHPDHFSPFDLLEDAKTVIAFFIPFTKELIENNRKNTKVMSREWALAYNETNELINEVCTDMKNKLGELGISCETVAATNNFDRHKLMSYWSHRHAAYIAGLGTFGISNMLITKCGCGGRYGSFVINEYIEPTHAVQEEHCLYKKDGSCGACVKLCPSGALTFNGFDRHKCYEYILMHAETYEDIGSVEACGKCDNGPCAVKE